MAWIEVHQELPGHWKTLRLARALQIDEMQAMGHMVALWLWALNSRADGDLSRFEPIDIACGAHWRGDPEAFLQALRTAELLDEGDRIHDWDDYAGRLRDHREANARRSRECRARKRAASRDDAGIASPSRHDDVGVASPLRHGATIPNRTLPNPTEQNQTSSLPAPAGAAEKAGREKDQPAEDGQKGGEAVAPTLAQVEAFAREAGLSVDARAFHALNQATHWRDAAGRPIRDWRQWLAGYAAKRPAPRAGSPPPAQPEDEYGGAYL